MHGVGVYDENAGELVVTDVVTKERASDDFRGVLRMLRESIGERANHKTMVATKRSLQTLLLLSLVHSTDALSLTSPIPFSVLEQLQLHGLSCWMASMLILYFMFASLLIAMPPRRDMWDEQPGGLHEQEPEHAPSSAAASSSSPAPTYNKVAVHCFLCICLRHRLELIDDAETESDTAMISALNAIHDVLMDVFSLFERDGISPASLQLVKVQDNGSTGFGMHTVVTVFKAMTSKHKSSRGKEQQMELLPFTALGHVTHDESWGSSWMDARATLLSWAAKSTMFTADEQLALGHHVNAQYRSAMIYSRDNQIGLCKKIHLMFCRIRDGSFDPDATRVSRLFQLAFDTALERDGGSSDSSSSTSDDASSVASSNGEHAVLAQKTTFRRLDADDMEADKCLINRHDEALHSKVDTSLALDNSGGLRLSKKQKLDDVNVTGEHKLRQAFLRRSLAYDLAGIATFAALDLWTQKLFEKMNETPLTNYRHISVEQAINPDKALWVKVSNDTRGKLQPKTGADKPFDIAFEKFSEHPEVLQHLTPLQSVSSQKHDATNTSSATGPSSSIFIFAVLIFHDNSVAFRIESLLPPDPPDDFFAEEMAPPYEPRSPEHMAMWMT
ncbi:unnamed protein product [Cladocopium goreaui]|uniref:Uncharacterized protein n=1 Tax=Cladocopium goreaui TaxID=2562237 RepID=A0A9P1D801_9DINO|nr:unnamed protein product [Cladocopium goreaui]